MYDTTGQLMNKLETPINRLGVRRYQRVRVDNQWLRLAYTSGTNRVHFNLGLFSRRKKEYEVQP